MRPNPRNRRYLKLAAKKQQIWNPEAPAYYPGASSHDHFGNKVIGIILVFIVVTALIALVFMMLPADAHDHNRPDLDSWYRGLGSARSPCCTGAEEGVKLLDADWRMDHLGDCKVTTGDVYAQNAVGTQYCVKMYNVWWLVPDNAVVKGANLVGVAIVWPLLSYGKNDEKLVNIRCFMPAPAY